MIWRSHKRLRLSSETVRVLADPALRRVVGGKTIHLTIIEPAPGTGPIYSPTETTCPGTDPVPRTFGTDCDIQ